MPLFSHGGLGEVIEPFLLKDNPPPGNEGDGSKSQGEGFLSLIPKGEVEEDRIRAIVVVPGKEDLLDFGKGNLQVNLLITPFPGYSKEQYFPLDP